MFPALQDHFGCAKHRLRGELKRDVAGKAFGDAAVRQTFNDGENISRAAAREACHGVHQRLVDEDGMSRGPQDLGGRFGVLNGCVTTSRDGRGPRSDHTRNVRHDTDHWHVGGDCRFDRRSRDAGHDGENESFGNRGATRSHPKPLQRVAA